MRRRPRTQPRTCNMTQAHSHTHFMAQVITQTAKWPSWRGIYISSKVISALVCSCAPIMYWSVTRVRVTRVTSTRINRRHRQGRWATCVATCHLVAKTNPERIHHSHAVRTRARAQAVHKHTRTCTRTRAHTRYPYPHTPAILTLTHARTRTYTRTPTPTPMPMSTPAHTRNPVHAQTPTYTATHMQYDKHTHTHISWHR